MFETVLKNVSEKTPLVHCITNYVTVNDVANIVLACGGSPIMADDIEEVEDITSICGALDINIGTLNQRTIASMVAAGKKANALGHPVVLDPVGAGASKLRTETTFSLLKEVKFQVIRGNISEMKTVALGSGTTKGVDADSSDAVTEENLSQSIGFAQELSKKTGAVIAITGAIDLVSDGERTYVIRNGHPMMSKITGTGCMLTGVVAAFCGANPENLLEATAAAVAAMGLCGQLAYERVQAAQGGTGMLRSAIIDAMSRMDAACLNGGMKIELH